MKLKSLTRHQLSNGLLVFLAHAEESAAFELSLHVEAGSRDEGLAHNGISHLLEHMMFRGSSVYSDSVALAKAMEALGGENNAMTTAENTVYWLRGAASRLQPAIEVFAEFFLRPTFPDLELERGIVLQELASDFNEEGLLIEIDTLGLSTMFGDHPLGMSIIGNDATIRAVGTAELESYRARHYTPAKCVLGVLTHLEPAAVLPWLEAAFGAPHWPATAAEQPVAGADFARLAGRAPPTLEAKAPNPIGKAPLGRMKLQENPDNQFSLKVLFPCEGGASDVLIRQNFLERLLNDGVASRLQASIRERLGLVYDISCDANSYSDVGVFNFDATVSADGVRRLLAALAEELHRACVDPPTEEEMERVRFRYLFDLQALEESPGRVLAREMSRHFLSKSMNVAEEARAVAAITSADVIQTARAIFQHPDRTVVLVGPKAKKQEDAVQRFFQTLSQR